MNRWRNKLRAGLILLVLVVAAAITSGLRERPVQNDTISVERSDPEAVIQTRGSRILQADLLGENLRVVADRQDTYRDGSLRLADNVQITIADRNDRDGFVLTGDNAIVDAGKSEVELQGNVEMESSNGLSAQTGVASYLDSGGIVHMPGSAKFERDDMNAAGRGAEYDRNRDVLRLLDQAHVDLLNASTNTRITSGSATLAQTDEYMEFEDRVTIETVDQEMMAERARITTTGRGNLLQRVNLMESAIIQASNPEPGGLRTMSARNIEIDYLDDGETVNATTLTDYAELETAGPDNSPGTRINGQTIVLDLNENSSQLEEVTARDDVRLRFGVNQQIQNQEVSADLLTASSQGNTELSQIQFDGNVRFQEQSLGSGENISLRTTTSDRLTAVFLENLTRLGSAHFQGNVSFENKTLRGVGDEARYSPASSRISLLTSLNSATSPRIEDRRGSIQATSIYIELADGSITTESEVKSVLGAIVDEAVDAPQRPGLLDTQEPAYATAGQLRYDGKTEVVTYSLEARLWQGETEFTGDELILDETNGSISIIGAVNTRSIVNQRNTENGRRVDAVVMGQANFFSFDDRSRIATYENGARLQAPQSDLVADKILIFLHSDSRTLGRIEAQGMVKLIMPGRTVTGETLVYNDTTGQYVMTGSPVHMTESQTGVCRETTGRNLSFSSVGDAVSVDGESQVRTETLRGNCSEQTP